MKIKYNMNKKYKKLFNEANGIIAIKNKLLKDDNYKIKTYTKIVTTNFIIFLLASIIFLGMNNIFHSNTIKICGLIILFVSIFYLIISIVNFNLLLKSNMNSHKGTITINEQEIKDFSENGNTIAISYNNIELIVITNNLIAFIANMPIMIFVPNKNKEQILNIIQKNSKIKIIDKSI